LDTQWDPSAATGGDDIHCLSVQGTRMFIGGKKTVGWFTDSVLTPPSAPASGAITSVNATGVQAQWAAATGATTYTLAAALNATLPPVSPISKTGIAGLTDTVTGLAANTRYYVSVSACNPGACSAYTALGSTVTPSASPTQLQALSRTLTTITLSWNSAGNAAGTVYVLQQSNDGGSTFFDAANTTATQATVTQLDSEQTYHFRVKAVAIAGGTSSYSSEIASATGAVAADLSRVRAFPNPTTGSAVIENLPDGAGVTIYTMAGELLRTLPPASDGRTMWDGKNESGEPVASGIYQAVANGAGTKTIRIAVQR
nr:fibronectin type III domain-containing protein [Elusimicrobiota bacterium]